MHKYMYVHKNPQSTAFKALQRETSVYKYFIELKEDVLTEQGFLDLAKVPGLRVVGARDFLKNLRKDIRLRQKDIAKLLNVSLSQVKHWENDRDILLDKLVKIAEILDISRDKIYSLINQDNSLQKTSICL